MKIFCQNANYCQQRSGKLKKHNWMNLVWNFQDIDNGHQNFPNQSEFGLESASCKINFFLSKPNWNWFGKSYAIFGCNFSKPNWIWFGKGHWIKCSCTALAISKRTNWTKKRLVMPWSLLWRSFKSVNCTPLFSTSQKKFTNNSILRAGKLANHNSSN